MNLCIPSEIRERERGGGERKRERVRESIVNTYNGEVCQVV